MCLLLQHSAHNHTVRAACYGAAIGAFTVIHRSLNRSQLALSITLLLPLGSNTWLSSHMVGPSLLSFESSNGIAPAPTRSECKMASMHSKAARGRHPRPCFQIFVCNVTLFWQPCCQQSLFQQARDLQ